MRERITGVISARRHGKAAGRVEERDWVLSFKVSNNLREGTVPDHQ
jgi:hypothetical protein